VTNRYHRPPWRHPHTEDGTTIEGSWVRRTSVAVATSLALVGVSRAEEAAPPARPWSDTSELAAVFTSGNSETKNFAFSNKYAYTWAKAEFALDAAALRAETTDRILAWTDGEVTETRDSRTTAEQYLLGAKYRQDITERFLWYVRGGWGRDEFKGFTDRYVAGGGLGHRFLTGPKHSLIGEAGGERVNEDLVDGTSTDYTALRAFLGYQWQINDNAKFNQDLELIPNLDESDDWRARSVTALTATLSKTLALKLSYTMSYENLPFVETVPGPNPGDPDAFFEYENLDTIAAASLVVNF
jgi:putative salt-induced outer membrane protein